MQPLCVFAWVPMCRCHAGGHLLPLLGNRQASCPASSYSPAPLPPLCHPAARSWANWVGFMAYGQVLASCLFLMSGLAGMVEQGNPGHL